MHKKCLAYFDGAVKDNSYYIGYVIYDEKRKLIEESSKKIINDGLSDKEGDSSTAEYLSLLELLRSVINKGIRNIHIIGDNRSVINACLGKQRKLIKTRYKTIHSEIFQIKEHLEGLNIQFTKRRYNKVADKICREAYKQEMV